jgi:hypothetical protein
MTHDRSIMPPKAYSFCSVLGRPSICNKIPTSLYRPLPDLLVEASYGTVRPPVQESQIMAGTCMLVCSCCLSVIRPEDLLQAWQPHASCTCMHLEPQQQPAVGCAACPGYLHAARKAACTVCIPVASHGAQHCDWVTQSPPILLLLVPCAHRGPDAAAAQGRQPALRAPPSDHRHRG